jgi:hypothetical protein
MTPAARYCLIWLGSLAGVMLLVAAVNFTIDPYEIFGSKRIAGIDVYKPAAKNHMMLAKTYQVSRVRPVTVLVGASNVLIGLDASSRSWPTSMRPVYNFGVPGTGIPAHFGTMLEAYHAGRLKYVIAVIDFEEFLSPDGPNAELSEAERRFSLREDGTRNPERRWQVVEDSALALFTLGALEDSVFTVAGQYDRPALDLRPDGSSTEAEFARAARWDGYHALFAQKEISIRDMARNAQKRSADWRGPLPNLDELARLLAFCRAHHIAVTLVLAPVHADALEIYRQAGLWPRIEQWKLELTALAARMVDDPIPVWDFVEYDRYVTEPVPGPDDHRSATSWFWEPHHFKKTLGELIIRRLFGGGPSDFGTTLTASNVALRNTVVRGQQRAYRCALAGGSELPAPDRAGNEGCVAAADRLAMPVRDVHAGN